MFKQPLVTTAKQLWPLDLYRIPIDAVGVDHDLDTAHFTVVLTGHHLVAGGFFEWFIERFRLHVLAHSAERNHGHFTRHDTRRDGCEEQGSDCFLIHVYL
ncbi:hypothetical protein D3C81_1596540 [compost metagenome]